MWELPHSTYGRWKAFVQKPRWIFLVWEHRWGRGSWIHPTSAGQGCVPKCWLVALHHSWQAWSCWASIRTETTGGFGLYSPRYTKAARTRNTFSLRSDPNTPSAYCVKTLQSRRAVRKRSVLWCLSFPDWYNTSVRHLIFLYDQKPNYRCNSGATSPSQTQPPRAQHSGCGAAHKKSTSLVAARVELPNVSLWVQAYSLFSYRTV